MAKKRLESDPLMPEIEKCPRCGSPILLGDAICKNCGYRIRRSTDLMTWFKQQPPNVISTALFVIGLLVAVSAYGTENPLQFIMLVIGTGLIISGGLFYGANLLVSGNDRRKEK